MAVATPAQCTVIDGRLHKQRKVRRPRRGQRPAVRETVPPPTLAHCSHP